jgi:hypothetical protein
MTKQQAFICQAAPVSLDRGLCPLKLKVFAFLVFRPSFLVPVPYE